MNVYYDLIVGQFAMILPIVFSIVYSRCLIFESLEENLKPNIKYIVVFDMSHVKVYVCVVTIDIKNI